MGMYIQIKDRRVVAVLCGAKPSKGGPFVDVPDDFAGLVGQDVREFDTESWHLRPLSDRVADGLIIVDDRHKIAGEDIVPKTELELIRDGLEQCPAGMRLQDGADSVDGLELVPMTRTEMVAAGQLSSQQAYELDLADCLAARQAAYAAEADPIFFLAQRGENDATIESWKAKIEEIKARLPKPTLEEYGIIVES